jgi:hypothetical protein
MCHHWLLACRTYSRPQRPSRSCLWTHLPLGQPNDFRYLWFPMARLQPYVLYVGEVADKADGQEPVWHVSGGESKPG